MGSSRRWVVAGLAGLGSSASLAQVKSRSAIVIGAGMAGLAAAQTLRRARVTVTVLEARDRLGGRIWTDFKLGIPLDLGAAWIHGPDGGNPIAALAKAAGARTFRTEDDSLVVFDEGGRMVSDERLAQLDKDYQGLLSRLESSSPGGKDRRLVEVIRQIDPSWLQDPLRRYALSAYLEFDTGGPLARLSARYWDSDERYPGQDVLLPDGYGVLLGHLAEGLSIQLGQVVRSVAYSGAGVQVGTDRGEFEADCAVITLPLGVLQQGSVRFDPPLPPAKGRSLAALGMGVINKVALRFESAFWDLQAHYLGSTSSRFPYFLNIRSFRSANVLVAFVVGETAQQVEAQSDAAIQADLLSQLRRMFGPKATVPQQVQVTRWGQDPYARGAYSYMAVGSSPADRRILADPVANKLFFAGEHTSPEYWGTVHGAYWSGRRAAKQVLRTL